MTLDPFSKRDASRQLACKMMIRKDWKTEERENRKKQEWLAHTERSHDRHTHAHGLIHTHTHTHTHARVHALVHLFLRTCSHSTSTFCPTSWPRDFSSTYPPRPFCLTASRKSRSIGLSFPERLTSGGSTRWNSGRVWKEDAVARCDML